MAMYEIDDINTDLHLDLPKDEQTLESYEEPDTTDLIDGYMVENFRGFDIAVLGHPKDMGLVMGGANPAHTASYEDEDYTAHVTLSPRPMDFDAAFRIKDSDIRIGEDEGGLTPDDYIGLEQRDQPAPRIRELMEERDDFRESALEELGRYVLHRGQDPVGDDRTTALASSLTGTEPVDPEEYDRVANLAHHYALDR